MKPALFLVLTLSFVPLPLKAADAPLPVEIGKTYRMSFSLSAPTGSLRYPYLDQMKSGTDVTILSHKGGPWFEVSYQYYDFHQQDPEKKQAKLTKTLLLNLDYVVTIEDTK